jgi:YidC/Oxa1 family membrane protein insertase
MESTDRRTLIAVVLTIAVIIGYNYFFMQHAPQPKQGEPEKKAEEQVKKETPSVTLPREAPEQSHAKELTVETGLYRTTLTTKGGTIEGFILKAYKDKEGKDVSLINSHGEPPPLGFGVSSEDFALSSADFSLQGSDMKLKEAEKGSVIFSYIAPPFSIKRTYTFYGDRYQIDLRDEVAGIPEYWVALGSDFGINDLSNSSAPHVGPVILKDSDRIEVVPKKLDAPRDYKGGIRWVAEEDKYFFASIVPLGPVIEAKTWKVHNSAPVGLKVASGINQFIIYAGPKEYNRLQELNVGIEHIIDFGFFSFLARPLFWILKFFYSFIGNYGWSIVLLTIIVRVPFIPIINMGQRSMKRMQELQPKLNEIKERYKKDPQRIQKEMMELYKKYKVNPLSGCFPMLLQIPVFFALYKVLMIAIELRGAPFLLWIKDLSIKDPYYVLPIIMGVTMLVQQKMTPTSPDPRQNKMMMLMPVVFTFLFLNFASGLVLYWLVNNVLSIIQQFYANKKASR